MAGRNGGHQGVCEMSEKDRKERLAEQLRANIRRRKAQSHASRGGKADRRSGLPAAEEERNAPITGNARSSHDEPDS
ncbi:hypothetical protein [Notoacmeibacter sp. MSK16QG-6]|uniref:hypothetical protein n=1 Tax=Notoacmeibacter sp. MSK16QG-6 TaxID=2957982 RepID=UPI00209CB294|nr:hypothetical protein [Notoacmeibacter sp. MSK16QG-6]MCP1198588.1 hypothetical protein [Notoacmeibacter sp. MSK16QG-6]